ncbi:unnamed protein product, partial [Phaeothamnion confervicola]
MSLPRERRGLDMSEMMDPLSMFAEENKKNRPSRDEVQTTADSGRHSGDVQPHHARPSREARGHSLPNDAWGAAISPAEAHPGSEDARYRAAPVDTLGPPLPPLSSQTPYLPAEQRALPRQSPPSSAGRVAGPPGGPRMALPQPSGPGSFIG